jgi:Leucine rich repeat
MTNNLVVGRIYRVSMVVSLVWARPDRVASLPGRKLLRFTFSLPHRLRYITAQSFCFLFSSQSQKTIHTMMSLKPDTVDPVGAGPRPHDNDDRRGSDPPPFKHQVDRILAEEEVPMAEATPVVADSSSASITTNRIEGLLLRLEAQLDPERERVANPQQQEQGERPPAPSTTTGSAAKCCSFSTKQKRWIALVVVLVAVVVLVLLAIVLTKVGGGPTPVVPSSVAPATTSPVPRAEAIVAYINSITLSNRTLSYPPSKRIAEERAVQWLIEDDLNTVADDLKALRQRYALSTLWFIPTPVGFGTDGNHADTWTINLDECAWLGVRCAGDGRVTALYLSEQNVQGRIPDDLGLLTAMTSLDLWGNNMTGTIPSSLAAMTDLVKLGLDNNRLTGTIPSSLAALTAMTSFQMWENRLNGTIPSSLGALTGLEVLDLGENMLTGTIPSSLAAMTALTSLWLSKNALVGTIPSSLAALTNLTILYLHNNQLNGTLPLCGLNRTFEKLVADCAEVSCPCCTHCCPTAGENGIIPIYDSC